MKEYYLVGTAVTKNQNTVPNQSQQSNLCSTQKIKQAPSCSHIVKQHTNDVTAIWTFLDCLLISWEMAGREYAEYVSVSKTSQ